MYLAELSFRVIADTDLTLAETAIRRYMEALIFNGQALGREFPTAWQPPHFCCRIVLPAEDTLHQPHHSSKGLAALEQLADAGLSYPAVKILGIDLMSQHSAPSSDTAFYVLYSRFSDSCSPIRCADYLSPVPLYLLKPAQHDFEPLIRWQIQFQALDEIQMQQDRVLYKTAERSLQQLHSTLNRQGRRLAKQLEAANQRPVYYALYSGSSKNCQQEEHKLCPGCGANWRLTEPLLAMFDFKCDNCRLVSNIAWECQSPSEEQGLN